MKDTILRENSSINCGGNLLSLASPIVMGIVNATPDSFYDGGKNNAIDSATKLTNRHLEDGAKIIDVGGYSSRPGAQEISVEEELQRVIPIIEGLVANFPNVTISIDTFRSEVAKQAIGAGAQIVNDIAAGDLDSNMFATIAQLNVPYIMMHMQNNPSTMQDNPQYENITIDVAKYFSEKLNLLRMLGVRDVVLDVGFGFGKTVDHNYQLLNELAHFKLFETPILVGLSRKSMLCNPLNIKPNDALNATTGAHIVALQNGANILRVHDTKEAMEAIKVYELASKTN